MFFSGNIFELRMNEIAYYVDIDIYESMYLVNMT